MSLRVNDPAGGLLCVAYLWGGGRIRHDGGLQDAETNQGGFRRLYDPLGIDVLSVKCCCPDGCGSREYA